MFRLKQNLKKRNRPLVRGEPDADIIGLRDCRGLSINCVMCRMYVMFFPVVFNGPEITGTTKCR